MATKGTKYDSFDPFGAPPKVLKKKRPNMPSIHQYAALAGFREIAQARDGKEFDSPDKDLFLAGVRPGQTWTLVSGSPRYMAVVGSHDKGFIIFNLRAEEASPVPSVSLFKFPRQSKTDLLNAIKEDRAQMLCCVTSRHVDDDGHALPGRELDVALSALMVRPTHWYEPGDNRNYFINVCNEGHYSITQQYVPSGTPCDERCTVQEKALKIFIEDALCKVFRGKTVNRRFQYRATDNIMSEMAITPFSYIEVPFDTLRILQANKEGFPRKKTVPNVKKVDSWMYNISEWLLDNGVRSGMIFKIESETGKSAYLRLHRRGCGYFHAEVSPSTIFTGETDLRLVQELMARGKAPPTVKLDGTAIRLDQRSPFVQCHCCRSSEPLIVFPKTRAQKKLKIVQPHEIKMPPKVEPPAEGDLVLYRGKPVLYYKTVRTKFSGNKAMIVLSNGRVINCWKNEVRRRVDLTPELRKQFLDEDGLLKKKFNPQRWQDIITVGSRLRVRPGLSEPGKYELGNCMVTVSQPPFRVGDDSGIRVLESEATLNLRTDVLPRNTFPLAEGMELGLGEDNAQIVSITDGMISLRLNKEVDIGIPEPALHIMLSRERAKIKQVYTVDSLI
jgi:hypothetical protein